ncbi:NAD(P)-binding domain-containing protein [Myxococcota bacterium]|nr:NAD(P)-binding domain-containing protein [Myxococcota bacterium]
MKLAFLGTGNMSRVIAGSLAELGHDVFLGSRSAEKSAAIARDLGARALGGTNDEAAAFGEVIFHSVRNVPSTFLRSVSPLSGKVIVDLNNRDFPRHYSGTEMLESLAAAVQKDVPSAKVVKALNNQAMEALFPGPDDLRRAGIQSFVAGDSAEAKAVVSELLTQMGLTPVDFGPLANAWMLEVQADILRTYMFATGDFLATPGFIMSPKAPARFGERRKGEY